MTPRRVDKERLTDAALAKAGRIVAKLVRLVADEAGVRSVDLSVREIMDAIGTTNRSATKAIDKAEANGLLVVERGDSVRKSKFSVHPDYVVVITDTADPTEED